MTTPVRPRLLNMINGFVAFLSSGPQGFKRYRSSSIIFIIIIRTRSYSFQCYSLSLVSFIRVIVVTAAVAKWVRAWDTLPMFEATVCGRS